MLSNIEDHRKEIEELKEAIAEFRSDKKGRQFSDEIRRETLRLCACGIPMEVLSVALCLSKSVIYKWKIQSSANSVFVQKGTASPRVFAVRDDVAMRVPEAAQEPQTLRLQIGAFDITVALRMESR